MNVNPEITNTLILAVLEIDNKAIAYANLRTWSGMEEAILETTKSAMLATKIAIQSAITIKANQLFIMTNSQALVDLYTHPIRLPLRKPGDLVNYYRERGGEYRQGMWITPTGYGAADEGQTEWEIMRLLCNFDRWQFKYLHEDNMKRTKELWLEHYTK